MAARWSSEKLVLVFMCFALVSTFYVALNMRSPNGSFSAGTSNRALRFTQCNVMLTDWPYWGFGGTGPRRRQSA